MVPPTLTVLVSDGHLKMPTLLPQYDQRMLVLMLSHVPIVSIGAVIQCTVHPRIGVGLGKEQYFPVVIHVHLPRHQQLAMVVHALNALRLGFRPRERG